MLGNFRFHLRIRKNVLNGLAVAPVLRGACGGCFAQIPPQLQSDIRQRKKIVICENCGRVLVDAKMAGIEEVVEPEKAKTKSRRKNVRKMMQQIEIYFTQV